MSDDAQKASTAYAPKGVFFKIINDLAGKPPPDRIDRSVFGNMNGGLAYSILASMRTTKLIDAEGKPLPLLMEMANATDADRPALLRRMLEGTYPAFFNGTLNLKTATAAQFHAVLRDTYGAQGSTIDKAAIFFLSVAEEAGVEVSDFIRKRTPVAASSASRKSAKARKAAQVAEEILHNPPPPPHPPPPPAKQSPVDVLMSILDMSAMDETETEAVWTLVKFLKRPKSAAPGASEG